MKLADKNARAGDPLLSTDVTNSSSRGQRRQAPHFKEDEIAAILKELRTGRSVTDLSRQFGVSRATLYVWKAKYERQRLHHSQRVQELEDENRRLKQLIGELCLEFGKPLKALMKRMPDQ